MPHIVLTGRATLGDLQERWEPFVVREGELLVKADRFYRESTGRVALVETLVSDRGHTQKFFIQLAPREDGITVRLEPLTDPEKTSGVKRALAIVAHWIRGATGASYGQTNIEEFLVR